MGNILFNRFYQAMVGKIVSAVAAEVRAEGDDVISDGCIRITIIPRSSEADEWLGGVGNYIDDQVTDIVGASVREFCYTLNPRKSYAFKQLGRGYGYSEPVSCYGRSALETAFAFFKRDCSEITSIPRRQQRNLGYTEDNGWSTWDNTAFTTVVVNGEEFMRLFVTVSEVISYKNKHYARVGITAAQTYLEHSRAKVQFRPE